VGGSPAAGPSLGGWCSSGRGCSGRAGCRSRRQRRCGRYQRPAPAARRRDPGACRSSAPPCLACSRHQGTPNPPAAGRGRPPTGRLRRAGPVRQSRHVGSLISQSTSASGPLVEPQKAQRATIPPPLQPSRGMSTDTGPRAGAFTIPHAWTSQGFCVARIEARGQRDGHQLGDARLVEADILPRWQPRRRRGNLDDIFRVRKN